MVMPLPNVIVNAASATKVPDADPALLATETATPTGPPFTFAFTKTGEGLTAMVLCP